jgi:D-alanine-D-alanine ligase
MVASQGSCAGVAVWYDEWQCSVRILRNCNGIVCWSGDLPGEKMGKKLRIALIAGGKSGEREVSLSGAAGVERALDPQKFEVVRYDAATDLGKIVADADNIDFAFILLHGLLGEDGTVQGFLELLEIPYQGSGVLGSAIAMNKHLAKELYRLHNLPVADWLILDRETEPDITGIVAQFGLPVVIKPVQEGSSLGLTLAQSEDDLVAGIARALTHDREIMVERYIRGRELTVGVLGNQDVVGLPVIEIIPGEGHSFFDYDAKYKPGATKEVCPAEIDTALTAKVQEYGVAAHRALRLRGYSRTDMMLAGDGQLYLLETNTIPGMTPTSLMPQAAAAYGLPFPALLEKLIALGMEDHQKGSSM